MNCDKFKAICTKAIVAAIVTSGMLALGTQAASAQAVTATVPFAFSAGDQPFPAGTYQFTFLSQWSLSIRNVKGGGERFFTVQPQENESHASQARIVFHNSGRQKNLKAVYLPASGGGGELLRYGRVSPKDQSLAQSATLR
ncbi:MAG: hypothetical protein QOH35_4267 [Acidobacteriaceae bacterium]|nr:hypothetical protein [Acidobacteriaceae bacterium]